MKTHKLNRQRVTAIRLLTVFVLIGGIALLGPTVESIRAQSDMGVSAKMLDDDDVANAVATDLLASNEVTSFLIDVKAAEGIVTLDGSVNNLLEKDRATEIAESIKGVRAVVNNLSIRTPERSDAAIANDVKDAIMLDPATEAYEVSVTVDRGLVTLDGRVDSWQEKDFAGYLAKGVRGVTGIENDIVVKPAANRSDFAIKEDIRSRFQSDVWVEDGLIDVVVTDGAVDLRGIVGSSSERQRAVSEAWVAGVTAVHDDSLNVKWWARNKMRRAREPVMWTDTQVETAVTDALSYDPRVESENITVISDKGQVTLSGRVNNLRARNAAEDDALNAIGVWDVKNYIRVRPDALVPNDTLELAVLRAFERSPYIDAHDLDIRAMNGQVLLDGHVHNSFVKSHATHVAATMRGVIAVSNDITYDHEWEWKSDLALQLDVNRELFWSPYVDTAGISVHVEDGVVTLNGEVDSWPQSMRAEQAAYTAGARDVRNRLAIRYFPDPTYAEQY